MTSLRTDKRLLIVLSSLCAEGTPVLTLELGRRWQAMGISPVVVSLGAGPHDLAGEFRAAQIPVETLILPARTAPRFAALTLGIGRLCRRLRPAAVLSMPLGWHAFSFLGARAAGVRATAAHVGNYPPVGLPETLRKFRLLVQAGRPLTDKLICCSSYIEQGVWDHFGIPRHKTEVIYNGIDVQDVARRADAARSSAPPARPFVVGMVARLEVHKDQPTLIRAAAALRAAGRQMKVWLVGEGSRRGEYERLVRELGLTDTVELLGMRRDVPELLGAMDAFVFSAKPDEGLGVALIEALAARLPIIATNVGACREVLLDGALGKLVPEGDATAMAAAIAAIMDDPASARAAAERGLDRAREAFSIDQMAARYAACLRLK